MDKNLMHLTSNFTVKGMNDNEDSKTVTIEGYANTTSKDRYGDVVLEEAWTKGALNNYLKNPIILGFHNHSMPIGTMTEYSVNNQGLKITAEISEAAGDIYNLVKSGVLKAFSIGFSVKDADYDADADIFVIKDVELYEISVVSVPANADSTFSVKKSLGDDSEYTKFKKSFTKQLELSSDKTLDLASDKIEEETVDKDKLTLTPEELKAANEAAVKKALADIKAKEEKEAELANIAAEAGKSGAERLMEEVEKRFEEKNADINTALDGLREELKEKNAEIEAMQKSKMSFEDKTPTSVISVKEADTAVLLAKIMGRRIEDTKYFKNIVEKAGAHLTGTNANNFETEFSSRMYDAVMDKLVLEPLFTNRIEMNARSMVFPFNPEAGHANWVADTSYSSTNDSSSGTARTHSVTDITLKAEKLATKESIGYEEDEDAIIPILPIIQAAVSRRMARTTDLELLRGNIGAETVTGVGNALINGVATIATDVASNGASVVQGGTFGSTNPVTVTDMQAVRRKMGSFGLSPSDIVYVVNQSVYFDLLEDPDFRTVDMVGSQATILTGQIGTINGSPVIVSDAFATPATNAVAAIALNASNFLFGELRGMTTERDRDVLNQKNWLVSTRRFAFNSIVSAAAGESAVAALIYPAS